MMDGWHWFDIIWPERSKHLLSASKERIKLNRIHYQDTAEALHREYDRLNKIIF